MGQVSNFQNLDSSSEVAVVSEKECSARKYARACAFIAVQGMKVLSRPRAQSTISTFFLIDLNYEYLLKGVVGIDHYHM